MTSLKTIAVAGLLSVMAAAPAFAQEAIQEPGAFAFYYPNLDVLVQLMRQHKKSVTVFQKEHRYHFGTHSAVNRSVVKEYLILGA